MKVFKFKVELSGVGNTQEEAWQDAVDQFAIDPGEPGEIYESPDLILSDTEMQFRIWQSGIMSPGNIPSGYGITQNIRASLSAWIPHNRMRGWYSITYMDMPAYTALRRVAKRVPNLQFFETERMKRLLNE